ncbi:hypothetical protein IEQ34_005487 [Dendrobium chrysotoxum]|uniref:Uncharacterized protein ycf72 n=1 Tax=Dendrobium chrysotoxum TaxID=161865 RepID=A0AAV7HBA4_DENCH|nr:hypothetical protein IEQ34_005487 [Dendrobium chrysotoxum]
MIRQRSGESPTKVGRKSDNARLLGGSLEAVGGDPTKVGLKSGGNRRPVDGPLMVGLKSDDDRRPSGGSTVLGRKSGSVRRPDSGPTMVGLKSGSGRQPGGGLTMVGLKFGGGRRPGSGAGALEASELSLISSQKSPSCKEWGQDGLKNLLQGRLQLKSSPTVAKQFLDIKRTSQILIFAIASAALTNCPPFPSAISMLCMAIPKSISVEVDSSFFSIKTPSQTVQASSKIYMLSRLLRKPQTRLIFNRVNNKKQASPNAPKSVADDKEDEGFVATSGTGITRKVHERDDQKSYAEFFLFTAVYRLTDMIFSVGNVVIFRSQIDELLTDQYLENNNLDAFTVLLAKKN